MSDDGMHWRLVGLGDLMALMVEGWRVSRMHFADRSSPGGPPAAYFTLVRGPGEATGVFVPDDGRALSHRALVELFRDSPQIWKHRSPDTIAVPGSEPVEAPEPWGPVPEPFPEALALVPATLRAVVPVGQIQSAGGLDVAMVALERHEAGARLRWMCHASDGRPRTAVSMLDVVVVDDAGRLYRTACVEGPPEGDRLEGALLVAPAIPRDVRRVTVTVGTVWGDGGGPRQTPGPWVFPIPLAPEA
jgi:hypothetical protein